MWLVIKNRLPTRDRLSRFNIQTPLTCLLCSRDIETAQHVFFNCPFSQVIIRGCPVTIPSLWISDESFFERMKGPSVVTAADHHSAAGKGIGEGAELKQT